MVKQDSLLTKIAFLGISFVLTSAYAINDALPQMTEALHISSTEAQVLATTPSITVTILRSLLIIWPFNLAFHLWRLT